MSTPVHRAIAALPVPGEWTWQVVVRLRRRTLGIEVDESGDVLFAVPPNADPAAVARAVRTRLPRLAREVRDRRARPDEPAKELVGGTGSNYLGRRHRLRLLPAGEGGRVRLYRSWLELPRPRTADEGARRIAQWYEACGTRWLAGRLSSYASRITHHASRVGLPAPRVEARDLGPKWGALGQDRDIAVHWAVLQLPPSLVDLVLVHELCHLRAPGHGVAFRRQVRLVLPDAEEREKLFADAEPVLWRGAVR
ncbi:YgjP-like metallopeptidase domain-containing protein [Streptomyces sp. ITFR-6]|uniref:M48 family metallopeptidase n=1 Tax=Streptomyces sp. ITFR-6 TaxID=3075197 RepID=UPI00288BA59A|nr:YgjP-like metallopeptidase domain-containing protein [Streptomyces sp. ITFR-6]WNI29071.1 DUF45 domain-containing protein [Streptomyces sp. ITFR-6]